MNIEFCMKLTIITDILQSIGLVFLGLALLRHLKNHQ